MKHPALTPRSCFSQAAAALFYASNWITALLTTFTVLLICFTAFYLADSTLAILSLFLPIPYAVDAVLYMCLYLLLSPLALGLLLYYTDLFHASHGDGPAHVPPTVIFSPYAAGTSLFRAWAFSALTLSLCALIPITATPMFHGGMRIISSEGHIAEGFTADILFLLGCFILFLAALWLNARLTPVLFLSSARPELSVGSAVRKTWRNTRDTASTAVVLQITLLAAGTATLLLTAGIGFFFAVLPLSVFVYVSYCHAIAQRTDLN